jgi:hypothetical protein
VTDGSIEAEGRMDEGRALYQIVYEVVSYLDAGMPAVEVSDDEIAGALRAGNHDEAPDSGAVASVRTAVERICAAQNIQASLNVGSGVWTFRRP